MSTQDAGHVLGVSHMTVSRSRNRVAWGNWLVNLQYPPGVTRDRWNERSVEIFHEVMDEVMPYASGRDWREQIGTNQHLYEVYVNRCVTNGVEPMSLTFFQTNGKF